MSYKLMPVTRLFVTTTILFLLGSVCSATEPNLRSDVEAVLAVEGLTGIAWSLLDEDGVVSVNAAGLQDNEAGLAFDTDTQFHVGSVTKLVLATGILRLVTEGRIELHAPASRYLPGITFNNSWARTSRVSVRHLLDHTSGLNDARLWQMFSARPLPDAPLIAAFPKQEDQLRIRSQPGTRFSYSNTGYTLLGMIIESVAGQPYETYLDEFLLAPLAMHDSTFVYTTQEGDDASPRLAWGHIDDGSRYPASPVFLRPAAQFTSTAADLGRFAQFLLSDGTIDNQSFIDSTLMRSRGKASATLAANAGLEAGYALGLGRRDRHGVVGYCHGGNIVGFVAMVCIFPDDNKAFAYSVNTDSETASYGRLDSLFVNALGIAGPIPMPTRDPAPDISEWYGRYTLSPNRFATFQYLDDVFGAAKISANDDSLTMSVMQKKPRELYHLGERIYSADNRASASHVFLRGPNGEYLISDGFRTYEKTSSIYLFAHWISVALGLIGLAWLFLAGLFSFVRYRTGLLERTVAPAFVAMLILALPVPFFFFQSFMAMGDLTLASALLAAVTLLLPFGILLTLLRARKTWQQSKLDLAHGVAAVFVLQWCVALCVAGLLPLALWTL